MLTNWWSFRLRSILGKKWFCLLSVINTSIKWVRKGIIWSRITKWEDCICYCSTRVWFGLLLEKSNKRLIASVDPISGTTIDRFRLLHGRQVKRVHQLHPQRVEGHSQVFFMFVFLEQRPRLCIWCAPKIISIKIMSLSTASNRLFLSRATGRWTRCTHGVKLQRKIIKCRYPL